MYIEPPGSAILKTQSRVSLKCQLLMDDRRKNLRTRARIPCNLTILATGKRFSGNTKNISLSGAEFEAAESMTRPGQAVAPGSAAVLTIMYRRSGSFDVLKLQCRVAFVAASSAGLEFTSSMPTLGERAALQGMVDTGSNRVD